MDNSPLTLKSGKKAGVTLMSQEIRRRRELEIPDEFVDDFETLEQLYDSRADFSSLAQLVLEMLKVKDPPNFETKIIVSKHLGANEEDSRNETPPKREEVIQRSKFKIIPKTSPIETSV